MANNTMEKPVMQGGFFTGSVDLARFLYNAGVEAQKNNEDGMRQMSTLLQQTREINGQMYIWDDHRSEWKLFDAGIPDDAPVPETLRFFTLDGLVAYINGNPEGLLSPDEKLIVHVCDEHTVMLLSNPSPNKKRRHVIARTDAHTPEITFGRYMDTERFNTMLLSTFHKTDERETVFALVKSMTKQQTAQTADDGVTQSITVKEGVATASNVQFKNPVPLKPMRTFTEVEQPVSNFTLRINEDANVALFESDGGAWKNEAVANIARHLEWHIKAENVVVIA